MVLEKTPESSLGSKEIKPGYPKGNQPRIFIGRTDVEAAAPTLWPPGANSRLTGKDPEAGKDLGQQEKRVKEGEMVGWHHQQDFEQTPGDSERQEPWCPQGHKELDTTERLNSKQKDCC